MLSAALLLAASLVQAAPAPAGPAADPFYVEDPFVIEEEPVSTEPAAAPPAAQVAEPSPDRIICRSRPELNTRTRMLRVCMTAAEWAHHATNMEQQRRDINDWGAQGSGAGPGQ